MMDGNMRNMLRKIDVSCVGSFVACLIHGNYSMMSLHYAEKKIFHCVRI